MSIVLGTPGGAYGPGEAISDIITFAQDPRVREAAFTVGRGIKRGYEKARGYFKRKRVRSASRNMPNMKPTTAGGIWQGRFGGHVVRGSSSGGLRSGVAETNIYSSNTSQPMVNYIGFSSMPLGSTTGAPSPGRVLDDMCMAVFRRFFKKHHSCHFDIESQANWTYGQYRNSYQIISNGTGNNALPGPSTSNAPTPLFKERYIVYFDTPDSTQTSYRTGAGTAGDPYAFTYESFDPVDSSTLRDFGTWLATKIWYYFYEYGKIPFELACVRYLPGNDGIVMNYPVVGKETMRLNGLVVMANVRTRIKLQNLTEAEELTNGAATYQVTAIGSNPLRGKMYMFKGLAPAQSAGFTDAVGSGTDEFFTTNYKWPSGGVFPNVFTVNTAPSGVWQTLPSTHYFKNCIGVKDVSLEPGVQKYETLKFAFKGTLVQYLRKLYSWFGAGVGHSDARNHAYYQYGLGSHVLFAYEKRIRAPGNDANSTNVAIGYQVETDIWCDVQTRTPVMTKEVVSTPSN